MILLAILAAGALAASDDVASASAGVERWTAVLHSPESSPKDLEAATVALRSIASGLRDDPATREACFALARYWSERGEEAHDEAIRSMSAAVGLYPEDPRTPETLERLAEAQLAADDTYGAYLSLRQRIGSDPAAVSPTLLARGADCAARAGDHASALVWAMAADPDAVDRPEKTEIQLARLISGEALRRYDVALEAAEWFVADAGETLHVEPEALAAAGRTFEATGLLDEAIRQYTSYVNIFPDREDRPAVLLSLGRLLARTGQPEPARRFLDWLVETNGDTPEAVLARLELLELDDAPARLSQVNDYLDVIRNAPDMASARAACDRFVIRYLGAGFALEALTAMRTVVLGADDPNALYPLVAKDAVLRALDPILALLESRGDELSLAAASVEITALDIPVPRQHREKVAAARRSVGLPSLASGPLDQAVAEARTAMAAERWSEAVDMLRLALASDRAPLDRTLAEASAMLAEALWRDGRSDEALAALDEALQRIRGPELARPLLVLRADILFAGGDLDAACASYRGAAEAGASRWVDLQLERCPAPTAAAEAAEPGPGPEKKS